MSRPDRCPHCDGRDILAMSESPSMQDRLQIWYQCRECRRVWSHDQPRPANGESEESRQSER